MNYENKYLKYKLKYYLEKEQLITQNVLLDEDIVSKQEQITPKQEQEQIKIPILEEFLQEEKKILKEEKELIKEEKEPIKEEKEPIKEEKELIKEEEKEKIVKYDDNDYNKLLEGNSDIKIPSQILPMNKLYEHYDHNQNIYLQKSILQEQKKKNKLQEQDKERLNEHNESLKQTNELNITSLLNLLDVCELMFLKGYLYCSFINITDMNKLLLQTKSTTLFSSNYWNYKPNGYVLWCSLIRKIKWEDVLNEAYLLFEYNIINENNYKEYLYIPELLLSNFYDIKDKNLLFIKINDDKIILDSDVKLNNYIHFMKTYKLNTPYIKWLDLYKDNYSGIIYENNNDIKYNINNKLYNNSEIFYNWLFYTLALWDYNAINSYVLFEKNKNEQNLLLYKVKQIDTKAISELKSLFI